MDKIDIYNALVPSWWQTSTPNSWNTQFVSAVIIYDTKNLTNCTYVSSAPIQTNGLNAGTDAYNNQLDSVIDILRTEASQRLFDMHCTQVTGHEDLTSVFNATA